ncbi:hypothetical protein ACFXDO_35510 [Streptomyces nigra]|uniref:hypothetical protein n=1 Tax=Streptomyces nigra TaxID=1827580 RepID=UPI003685C31A
MVSEPFTAGTEDLSTSTRRIVDRAGEENWDVVVALTDLPLHAGRRKLAVDLSHEHGLALLSLPSLGGLRFHRRARRAVLSLLDGRPASAPEPRHPDRCDVSPAVSPVFTRVRSTTRRPRIAGTSSAGRAAT